MTNIRQHKTKPWNTDLTSKEPNEELFIDFTTAEKTDVCSLKFKTTLNRVNAWVDAHRQKYTSAVWTSEGNATLHKMDLREGRCSLVVRLCTTTGVVVVQGALHQQWQADLPRLRDTVDNLCDTSHSPNTTQNDDHDGSILFSQSIQDSPTRPKRPATSAQGRDSTATGSTGAEHSSEGAGVTMAEFHKLQTQVADMHALLQGYMASMSSSAEDELTVAKAEINRLEQKVLSLESSNTSLLKLIDTMSTPSRPEPSAPPAPEQPTPSAPPAEDLPSRVHAEVPTFNRYSAFADLLGDNGDMDSVDGEVPDEPANPPDIIEVDIISSSMGRGAAELLNKDSKFSAKPHVFPGANARRINGNIRHIPASEFSVVMAGTIDITQRSTEECKEEVKKVMDNISRKRAGKHVIMCELALRRDKKYLNKKIRDVNKFLHNLSESYENVHMLRHDNHHKDLKRDGLHFSYQGTAKLCLNIRSVIRKIKCC